MSVTPLPNAAGRRRSPVTLPGYLAGRPPRNKGLRYPPDPPTVEEIVAVMRAAGDGAHGARMRALIVLLWRAGLRITEALTVTEHDLDARLQLVRPLGGEPGAPVVPTCAHLRRQQKAVRIWMERFGDELLDALHVAATVRDRNCAAAPEPRSSRRSLDERTSG